MQKWEVLTKIYLHWRTIFFAVLLQIWKLFNPTDIVYFYIRVKVFLNSHSIVQRLHDIYFLWKHMMHKGQIKPKAVWARCRFSQKTNKRICFVCSEKQKSKQIKFDCLFFGRIYRATICLRFYLTFSKQTKSEENTYILREIVEL